MVQVTSGGLSKDFFELVKAIGESRSKQEEDRIILNEVNTLKKSINEARVPPKRMKEFLVRAVYVEMLGHDASFAYIHAVNLAQQKDLVCKRMGYLACSLCLNNQSELMLLHINTIQRDMSSPNFLEISSALTCVCRLMNLEMIPAIRPIILQHLSHGNESVRKKAIMALYRLYLLQPEETSKEALDSVRHALCDRDPSVRGASLHLLHELMLRDKDSCKDLISALVSMLKQIVDHKLPREYDYHRLPAPWMQIKLLAMMSYLGEADQLVSEQIYEVVQAVMRAAESTGANVGFAVLYECVRTITTIYPHHKLLELAAKSITRFISTDNHNLQFVGLTGLAAIVKANPSFAAQHQLIVVECLEDPDETLKRKTLDLLFSMTNPKNVRVIVEKLLQHLNRATSDRHMRRELATKIVQLAERYACDSQWYLMTINSVLDKAGDLIADDVASNLIKLIAEGPAGDEQQDDDFRRFAVDTYVKLAGSVTSQLPAVLARVIAWTLGEYASLVTGEDYNVEEICDLLCHLAERDLENAGTGCAMISGIMKLCARNHKEVQASTVDSVISKFCNSRNTEISQRCREFNELRKMPKLMKKVFPYDAFCDEIQPDLELKMLQPFVDHALAMGADPYVPPEERQTRGQMAAATAGSHFHGHSDHHATATGEAPLNFVPYEPPRKVIASRTLSGLSAAGQPPSLGGDGDRRGDQRADSRAGGRGRGAADGRSSLQGGTEAAASRTGLQVEGPRRWGPSGYLPYTAGSSAAVAAPQSSSAGRAADSAFSKRGGGGDSGGIWSDSESRQSEAESRRGSKSGNNVREVASEKEREAAALFSGLAVTDAESYSGTSGASVGVPVAGQDHARARGTGTSRIKRIGDAARRGRSGSSDNHAAATARKRSPSGSEDLLGVVSPRADVTARGPPTVISSELKGAKALASAFDGPGRVVGGGGSSLPSSGFSSSNAMALETAGALTNAAAASETAFVQSLTATDLTTGQVGALWASVPCQIVSSFRLPRPSSCQDLFYRLQSSLKIQIVQVVGNEGIAATSLRKLSAGASSSLSAQLHAASAPDPQNLILMHIKMHENSPAAAGGRGGAERGDGGSDVTFTVRAPNSWHANATQQLVRQKLVNTASSPETQTNRQLVPSLL